MHVIKLSQHTLFIVFAVILIWVQCYVALKMNEKFSVSLVEKQVEFQKYLLLAQINSLI